MEQQRKSFLFYFIRACKIFTKKEKLPEVARRRNILECLSATMFTAKALILWKKFGRLGQNSEEAKTQIS